LSYRSIAVEEVLRHDSLRLYRDINTPWTTMDEHPWLEAAARFSSVIQPRCHERIGRPADVDGDGTFALVITPAVSWLDTHSGPPLRGYTRPADFQSEIEPPFGNGSDVAFVSPELVNAAECDAVLAHEYVHAVSFSVRARRGLASEESWLNEAIAHAGEEALGCNDANVSSRHAAFWNGPENAPLVLDSQQAARNWRVPASRGAASLFMRYCLRQHGVGSLRRLIHSPHVGVTNVTTALEAPFGDVFRSWTLSEAAARFEHLSPTSASASATLTRTVTQTVRVRGTAVAFVRLSADTRCDDRVPVVLKNRIEVRGEAGGAWQFSILQRQMAGDDPSGIALVDRPTATQSLGR
jgi:hypothetical protein